MKSLLAALVLNLAIALPAAAADTEIKPFHAEYATLRNGDDIGRTTLDLRDGGDGTWTPRLRDAYADRVLARLAPHITNLSAVTDRRVLGPAELEAMNANLVGGDPYGGDCRIDQYALWWPLSTAEGHATGVAGLWHIGASTHPGPGLGGGSGFLVAQRLTRRRLRPRRA